MKDIFKALKSVKYLVDVNGQQVAVLLNITAWKTLNDCINQEDSAIVKEPRPLNSIEFELEEININYTNQNQKSYQIPYVRG